ncbi:hypothetical protein [Gimibacter soli]|uniref:Uncharacterized protein n=1 Tax=Gimibacter soli TaxID=3024400 RepID=A0AAF0BL22_9PROT|nr:hypothetical protein [Gimibacter soli]WCL54944.1 hypothetical protein PH603_04125 [Gimibacter soli]
MNTCYLHIGIFKTGSSALQVYFARNAEKLAAAGIRYPDTGNRKRAEAGLITSGNGVWLARSLLPKSNFMQRADTRDAQLKLFAEMLGNGAGRDLLLSSEFFSDIEPAEMQRLADVAAAQGYGLKILLYVRDQAAYLESLYVQHVKRRALTADPESYIGAIYKDFLHLHFGTFVKGLQAIAGEDNVRVHRYPADDLFATASAYLGVDPATLEQPAETINASLPHKYLPLLLRLNRLKPPQSFSDQIVGALAALEEDVRLSGTARTLLPPALTAKIAGHFAAENDALARQLCIDGPLFPAREKPYISLEEAAASLDLDSITNLLGGLLVEQEKRLDRMDRQISALAARLR